MVFFAWTIVCVYSNGRYASTFRICCKNIRMPFAFYYNETTYVERNNIRWTILHFDFHWNGTMPYTLLLQAICRQKKNIQFNLLQNTSWDKIWFDCIKWAEVNECSKKNKNQFAFVIDIRFFGINLFILIAINHIEFIATNCLSHTCHV